MRAKSQLLIFILILSLCGCTKKTDSQANSRPVAQPPPEPTTEVEIKAATPEDPGPIATVVSPLATWTKERPSRAVEPPEASPADHVAGLALPAPLDFLHRQFIVSSYRQFAFTVPPHMVNPKLRGRFRAFARNSPNSANPTPADIDLMLMNEREFDDLVRGRGCAATYEAESSQNQAVNYAIPPTHDRGQRYHLVFRNPTDRRRTLVKADFTVSFE